MQTQQDVELTRNEGEASCAEYGAATAQLSGQQIAKPKQPLRTSVLKPHFGPVLEPSRAECDAIVRMYDNSYNGPTDTQGLPVRSRGGRASSVVSCHL